MLLRGAVGWRRFTVGLGLLALGAGCSGGNNNSHAGGGPPVAWVADPASRVNTLLGTTAGGNTFPGADVPFGMVQWSPDTWPDRLRGGGYDHYDSHISGFSLTHLSGPGCGAMGDVPILPMTGPLPGGNPGDHVVSLSHDGEITTAGYYSVKTGSPAIRTELTATLHSAMARFTYPATKAADILIKLAGSQNGDSATGAHIVGSKEVTGWTRSGHFCGAGDQYTLHFDLVFDEPFTGSRLIVPSGKTQPAEVFLTFDTTANPVLQAKVGISFVSAANARANWKTENPDGQWDFDAIRSAAHAAWNALLGRIQIAGGSRSAQELFYTSLYHSLLHPNVFSDTNGQYMGFDDKVHNVSPGQTDQYANYSSWDIYHTQVQLSALVAPQQMSDSAQSMLNDAAQNGGKLPKWSLANGETYVMVGDPADGILAGYYAFGARNFDTAKALKVMLNEATVPNPVRPGLAYYKALGYLPDNAAYDCCNFYGSVSTLLEYCEADFALSQFASALGDSKDAAALLARSQNWRNVLNPATGLFAPKQLDGAFVSGVGLTGTQGMVEGSASQYRWIVSFDRQAQLTALGGPPAVNPLLDAFFKNLDDHSGRGALLANEFELGAQYWDNATGEPWKTQQIVNRLRTKVYKDAPDFIDNNDDLGALSSQLVWSMLGLFPDYPGSALLLLNGPEFPDERVRLPSGKWLTIHADGASPAAPYIQSLEVNGKLTTKLWLEPSVVDTGAHLVFAMGTNPNKTLGVSRADAPPSYGMKSTSALGFASPSPLVLTPSASSTVSVGAQSMRSDVAEKVSWTATATGSVGVSSTSGTFSLDPGARATQSLSVTAPATEGNYTLKVAFSASSGLPPPPVVLPVIVAPLGAISPYFNNVGVSKDGSGSVANFDGYGYSYSAQALAAAGVTPAATLSVGGVSYTWPKPAPGKDDNIEVAGQTIHYAGTTSASKIGLLGSASGAGAQGARGSLTVTYADNSTQVVPFVFSDWTLGGGGDSVASGDTVAAKCAYRNSGGGQDHVATYVFAFSAALTSSQPVSSIAFSTAITGGSVHIFDIELQ